MKWICRARGWIRQTQRERTQVLLQVRTCFSELWRVWSTGNFLLLTSGVLYLLSWGHVLLLEAVTRGLAMSADCRTTLIVALAPTGLDEILTRLYHRLSTWHAQACSFLLLSQMWSPISFHPPNSILLSFSVGANQHITKNMYFLNFQEAVNDSE